MIIRYTLGLGVHTWLKSVALRVRLPYRIRHGQERLSGTSSMTLDHHRSIPINMTKEDKLRIIKKIYTLLLVVYGLLYMEGLSVCSLLNRII